MQAGKGEASAGQGEALSKGNRAVMQVRRMWGGGTPDISLEGSKTMRGLVRVRRPMFLGKIEAV